jgi:hypothetical protein
MHIRWPLNRPTTRRSAVSLTVAAFVVTAFVVGCDASIPTSAGDGTTTDADANPAMKKNPPAAVTAQLVTGLQGAAGSTVGPGGALFVTEGAIGQVSRVDPETGDVTTFASGLPPSVIGVGGAADVAFIGGTAYVLVTLVDDPNLFPTGEVNGIYRVDGPNSFTLIADLGAWNLAHPPSGFDYFVETGVLYALDVFRGGFLVTDGHLNRVLHVKLDGGITEFMTFGNVVPTGLDVWGNSVFMAEAGPVPHLPENGRVVTFGPRSAGATEVASGAPLLVDVERGRGATLFALAQGDFGGGDPGAPAAPNTGSLVKVDGDGTFSVVETGLDRPTSLEVIGNTAYVVTLTGEIWTIANITGPRYGK